MIAKAPRGVRLLGLGLSSNLSERIKQVTKLNRFKVRLAFSSTVEGNFGDKTQIDILLVQVPSHFGQALKMVQELLYRFPRAALIVISPKSDPHLLVHFFRAGAYDVILQPFDDFELAQSLRRVTLRPGNVANPGDWTPLQAAAHFFTRPIANQWDDLADNLHRYFALFLKVDEHKRFLLPHGVDDYISKKHSLNGSKLKKLVQFLNDPSGIFFGLERNKNHLSWIVKLAPDFICYWHAGVSGRVTNEELFGTHFLNLLRGQREHYEAHLESERMRRLALTDEITGLWNQRRLTQDLEEKVELESPFALLFIDIDFFKSVNDQFGHVHGSQLLIDMASILRRELRGSDLIYRYGGDEFIVLLPETNIEEAKQTALRLSASIKANEFEVQDKPYKLSLSVGLAVYPEDAKSARALIDFADQMMYMSKKSGRGKVFHVNEVL
ncbi:MAG: GGDEF domain-containing protein [Bacteriovoracaceae bacterium]|nr:GGDEF domain-containing protein [Bacteriovoracaceae bacterium]